jgi:hypothetical protein
MRKGFGGLELVAMRESEREEIENFILTAKNSK